MQRRGSFYFNLIPWPASLSCSLAFLATPISRSRLVSWLLTRVYIPFNTRFRFPVRDRPYPRNPLLFRGESISIPETQVLYLAPINSSPFHSYSRYLDSVNARRGFVIRRINRDIILPSVLTLIDHIYDPRERSRSKLICFPSNRNERP